MVPYRAAIRFVFGLPEKECNLINNREFSAGECVFAKWCRVDAVHERWPIPSAFLIWMHASDGNLGMVVAASAAAPTLCDAPSRFGALTQ